MVYYNLGPIFKVLVFAIIFYSMMTITTEIWDQGDIAKSSLSQPGREALSQIRQFMIRVQIIFLVMLY